MARELNERVEPGTPAEDDRQAVDVNVTEAAAFLSPIQEKHRFEIGVVSLPIS